MRPEADRDGRGRPAPRSHSNGAGGHQRECPDTASLASIPERNPSPVLEVDRSGRVTYANPAAAGLVQAGEVLGPDHPLRTELEAWRTSAKPRREGERIATVELGDRIFVQQTSWVQGAKRALIFLTDVTGRREAQALSRYAEELERSNEELQRFAYVAAHDLQEPLRNVASFLQLIEQRYTSELDDEGREYIGYAVDGAQRMKALLRDLLSYARVDSEALPFRPVDLDDAVDQALSNLGKPADEWCPDCISREPLATVQGDPHQIVQLVQNLVGNALKFHGDDSAAVTIRAVERDDGWVLVVEDRGLGIEPDHQERIFTLFERLHTRDAYPGTGIGLTICARIAERHGGRFWVESRGAATQADGRPVADPVTRRAEDPSRDGTAFCTHLPKDPSPPEGSRDPRKNS